VISIDDADLLDDDSWNVIASVHAKTNVPLAITRRAGFDAETRSLNAITAACISIRLRSLSFESTTELLLDHLEGGEADLDLLTRIYRKSGGIPSLAISIAEAAMLSGAMTRTGTVWRATADLWHDSLAGAVERLISELPSTHRDIVEAIATLGVVDLDDATAMFGHEHLEQLEAADAITVVTSDDRMSVLAHPPLVTEWAQHSEHSIRRHRVATTAAERLPDYPEPESRHGPSTHSSASAAMISLVLRDIDARRATARSEYEQTQAFDSGVRYLDDLIQNPDPALDIDALLGELALLATTPTQLAHLRVREVIWEGTTAAPGTQRSSSSTSEFPGYQEMIGSLTLIAEIDAHGVPPDIEKRLDAIRHPAQVEAGWADLAEAHVRLVQGRMRTAADIVERIAAAPGTRLEALAQVTHAWATATHGEFAATLTLALERIDVNLSALKLWEVREYTRLAAACALTLGEYDLGQSIVDAVLTLGPPAIGQERSHVGILAYGAVFGALNGRITLAHALIDEAERWNLPCGPIPGSSVSAAHALLQSLTADRRLAVDTMSQAVRELLDHGYVLAAVDTGIIGGLLLGKPAVPPGIARHMHDMDDTWREALLVYATALEANDGDRIEAGIEMLTETGRLGAAQYGLTELLRIRRSEGDEEGAHRAQQLLGDVIRRRRETDAAGVRWSYIAQYQITANLTFREREIVRFVVEGSTSAVIAENLGISRRTVETHLTNIYQKLGVSNRWGLMNLPWVQEGELFRSAPGT